MNRTLETEVEAYRGGTTNRRTFIARVVALTGSLAATHLLLETSGLAQTVSEVESKQMEIDSQSVSYSSADAVAVSGYLSAPKGVSPKGAGIFPGVVVIHENRGLNDHTRDVARRLAAAGFVALAPDLLSRKGGTAAMQSPDRAREAIGAVAPEAALADLEAGLKFLNDHAKVAKGKLGSIGFCWGGARSFALATHSDLLRAAVVFYGSAPPEEQLAKTKCPVLGLYGSKDERITSQVPAVAAAMKAANKPFEHMIYPDADHAFFNDTGPRYNAQAAKDAWQRTLNFLRANLK